MKKIIGENPMRKTTTEDAGTKGARKPFSKGAEAELFPDSWYGRKALLKVRKRKEYRHPVLDLNLRGRRARREAKVLRVARAAGVKCPELFFEDEKNFSLTIEFLNGNLLSRVGKISQEHAREAGAQLAKLHSAGIAHGDYSASNLLATPNGICVIDFGLAEFTSNVEELAGDVLLFEKSLQTQSLGNAGELVAEFRKAYSRNFPRSKEVFSRVRMIAARARYRPKA